MMTSEQFKPVKPGKYAISGENGWTEIKSFGDRKNTSEPFIPKAVVTGNGNVIVFDRIEMLRRNGGPTGNEAVLYDNVADPVPQAVYSILRDSYAFVPPIVLNMQFDSMRNAEELIKHLHDPTSYGIASGRKPSGPCHFGHKLVIETISFFQKNGAQIFVPIADNEASLDPKIKNESQYKYFAADNLLDWGACGLNLDAAHVYLQSEEMRVMNIAYAAARRLDLATTVDVYGRETMADEMNFLFASLTQVGDILLPQHPDFGKRHSFMLSGADQDGNMSMTTTLANRAIQSYSNDPSATRYVKTAPSSLYVKSISNLDGKKESASEPDTTIYLGPSRNIYSRSEHGSKILESIRVLSLSDRIADSFEKIDRFNSKDAEKVAAAILRRQPLFAEFSSEKGMDVERFKNKLTEILNEHQSKRGAVFEHAVLKVLKDHKANGTENSEAAQKLIRTAKKKIPDFNAAKEPIAPRFWETPDSANVPESRKNVKTKWFYMVSEAAEDLMI